MKNFLEEKVATLGRVYAENVTLDFEPGIHSSLRYAFRIQPEASSLPTGSPIHVGNIAQFHSLRILLEFQVDPTPSDEDDVQLCHGQIKMEIPTRAIPAARIRLNLHLPVTAGPESGQPPQAILQCMSRLTLYRMQEKARQEVAAGEMGRATRHLQHLATHLLSQGEKELAQAVLMEAESINKTQAFSIDGDKRIKYGTRALMLLPGTDRMKRMILCPSCQHHEFSGTLFCSECGAQLTIAEPLSTHSIYRSQSDGLTSTEPLTGDIARDRNRQSISSSSTSSTVILRVVEGGHSLPLSGRSEYTLGRVAEGQPILPDVDLSPFDAYAMGVSRLHAALKLVNQRIFVVDLGSSNGTG